MRNRVDNTAMDDIYTPYEEGKAEPTTTESSSEQSQSQPEPETQDD